MTLPSAALIIQAPQTEISLEWVYKQLGNGPTVVLTNHDQGTEWGRGCSTDVPQSHSVHGKSECQVLSKAKHNVISLRIGMHLSW